MSTFVVTVLAFFFLWYMPGVRIIREHERGVVFRLGRFAKVLGPGFAWVYPGIDRVARVELAASIPEWRSLTQDDVEARLRELAEEGKVRAS